MGFIISGYFSRGKIFSTGTYHESLHFCREFQLSFIALLLKTLLNQLLILNGYANNIGQRLNVPHVLDDRTHFYFIIINVANEHISERLFIVEYRYN